MMDTAVSASRSLRARAPFTASRTTSALPLRRRVEALHPGEDRLSRWVVEVVDDLPVGEEECAVGVRRTHRVVGDDDDRLVVLVHTAPQEVEDLAAGSRVEVAGRLIGED